MYRGRVPEKGAGSEPRYVFGTFVSAASTQGAPQEGATNQQDEGDAGCSRQGAPGRNRDLSLVWVALGLVGLHRTRHK